MGERTASAWKAVATPVCTFFSACPRTESQPLPPPPPPRASLIIEPEPGPGTTRLADEPSIRGEYDCDNKPLPLLVVERHELVPGALKAGQEILHRFIYSACTANPSDIVRGTLVRRIIYQGRVVFEDTSEDVEVASGRWNVGALLKVPPRARPGNYDFEFTFAIPTTTIIKDSSFEVQE